MGCTFGGLRRVGQFKPVPAVELALRFQKYSVDFCVCGYAGASSGN
jgi:hypothetical protein